MFLLEFSLLSKTVPRYLYSMTLPTFTPSIKRSEITVRAFLKSINISFAFFYIQVDEFSLHKLLDLSTSTKSTESELEISSIAEPSDYFMIGVVSVPVQSFV